MDWLDLLAVQGTLKSLLQHHSSKASILRCWAFFIVQHSYPYMTTGKTIALTRRTFVGKVMSLLFNMLYSLLITFFQGISVFEFHGCNHHLQWFWSPPKIKSATVSPFICHEVMGPQIPWSSFSEYWVWRQLFHSPLSLLSRGSLVLLRFLP